MATARELAIAAVQDRADASHAADSERLRTVVGAGVSADQLTAGLRQTARLTLNFHPDRVAKTGLTVAAGLLQDGRYRPQRETGISNGMRFAFDGGGRTSWEHELFNGVYSSDDPVIVPPVYGTLDVTSDPHGGCPRFGSSYVVLEPHCLDRSTFCVGDSHVGPVDVGTITSLTSVLAGLFEQAAGGEVFGRKLDVRGLRQLIESGPTDPAPARDLDNYVEAQIHGGVDLRDDVAEIVLDPSFRSTDVERDITAAANRFEFDVRWHGGSELAAAETPDDFRGPTMRPLAAVVARPDGIIDAAALGRHALLEPWTPPTPEGDQPGSPRQEIKRLWHCLLRFGTDASAPTPPQAD